jgi:hypothetical protein
MGREYSIRIYIYISHLTRLSRALIFYCLPVHIIGTIGIGLVVRYRLLSKALGTYTAHSDIISQHIIAS